MEKGGASKEMKTLNNSPDLLKKLINRTVIITTEYGYFQLITNY